MKPIIPVHRDSYSYRKFLRPGALAALRDSRISSRSLRSSMLHYSSPQYLYQSSAAEPHDRASAVDATSRIVDRIPVFDGYGGPRCGRRKRVSAARSVLVLSLDGRDSNGNVSAGLAN